AANLPRLDPQFTDALYAAELVVPTRWKDEPVRLQAFYTIWEHAEAAKLKLGAPGKPEPYPLGEKELVTLLGQCGVAHEVIRREGGPPAGGGGGGGPPPATSTAWPSR